MEESKRRINVGPHTILCTKKFVFACFLNLCSYRYTPSLPPPFLPAFLILLLHFLLSSLKSTTPRHTHASLLFAKKKRLRAHQVITFKIIKKQNHKTHTMT